MSAQFIRQAITARSRKLMAMRMYLFTNRDLLLPGFRACLMKPAVSFLDHVHEQAIFPGRELGRHNHRDLNRLSRGHDLVQHSRPSLVDDLLIVVQELERDMKAGRLERTELPGAAAGIPHEKLVAKRLAGARGIEEPLDFLKAGLAPTAAIFVQKPVPKPRRRMLLPRRGQPRRVKVQ